MEDLACIDIFINVLDAESYMGFLANISIYSIIVSKSTHPTTLQSKHVLIDNHSQNNLNLLISRPKLELPAKCIKSHFIYPHNPLHPSSSQIINFPSKSRNSDITYRPKIVLYRTIYLEYNHLCIIHILRSIKSPFISYICKI